MLGLVKYLPKLWTNWITLLGTIITTIAGSFIVLALVVDLVNPTPNPYSSVLAFMIMPGAFIFGLTLIPLGLWRQRRRRAHGAADDPVISIFQEAFAKALANPSARGRMAFVAIATVLNVLIITGVGYRGLTYMDSVEFCGTVCHTVMQPEYTAYLRSPHSRVGCVECHIGPGASWAVRAKVDGLRQVWGVATGSYQTPIPSPVHELRPSRDTCEKCHWPAKFHGNSVRLFPHVGSDKDNSVAINAMMLKVGGEHPGSGEFHGIHFHVSPKITIEYDAHDDRRMTIGAVRVFKEGKLERTFKPSGELGPVKETRRMDCVDCHNRPTHIYDASPERALDRAFSEGLLDRGVPYLRAAALGVLSTSVEVPRETATATFRAALAKDYDARTDVAVTPDVLEKAAAGLTQLYLDNIFPEMKVGWGTYPSYLGHGGEDQEGFGCFRCHDDSHTAEGGVTISQDCDNCHETLAEGETPDKLPDYLRSMLSPAGS